MTTITHVTYSDNAPKNPIAGDVWICDKWHKHVFSGSVWNDLGPIDPDMYRGMVDEKEDSKESYDRAMKGI